MQTTHTYKKQTELFNAIEIEDDRIRKMQNWMKNQFAFNCWWIPSVRDIQKLANEFKVIDKMVLDCFEQEKRNYNKKNSWRIDVPGDREE